MFLIPFRLSYQISLRQASDFAKPNLRFMERDGNTPRFIPQAHNVTITGSGSSS